MPNFQAFTKDTIASSELTGTYSSARIVENLERGQLVKNEGSERRVPLHAELITRGFIKLVALAEVQRGPRLPPQPLQPGTPPRQPRNLPTETLRRPGGVAVDPGLKAARVWAPCAWVETCCRLD